MEVWNNVSHAFQSAFDPNQHGFLSNWENFQLGVDRVVNLVPHATTNSVASTTETLSQAFGKAETTLLQPLTYSPSFYILAGGGILLLLIIGYVLIKI